MFHLRPPQLLLGLAAVAIIATGIVYTVDRFGGNSAQKNTNVKCAFTGIQVCPDGSLVGRLPGTCEFAACPETNTNSSADATGDWITYENAERGFSLKYPPGGTREDLEGRARIQNYISDDKYQLASPDYYLELFFSAPSATATRCQERIDNPVPRTFDTTAGFTGDLDEGPYGGWGLEACVQTALTDLRLRIVQGTADLTLARQILDTLTFTDTAATADWKTFTNTTYGWSVQYPPSWQLTDTTNEDQDINVETTFSKKATGLQQFFTDNRADTLEQWRDKQLTQLPNANTTASEVTIAGVRAIRISTNVYDNASYIGFRKGNVFVNVITSNAEMVTNGMLATLTFTN